jgi:hypothetical protein
VFQKAISNTYFSRFPACKGAAILIKTQAIVIKKDCRSYSQVMHKLEKTNRIPPALLEEQSTYRVFCTARKNLSPVLRSSAMDTLLPAPVDLERD